MNSIYFEEKGEALLEKIGMPKAEFARRMGIQRQNVKALFKSKDLRVIQRAADVMGVPWIFLVGYAEEPDVHQLPIPSYEEYLEFARQYPGEYDVPENASSGDSFEIAPEDIPTGDSVEDRRAPRCNTVSRQSMLCWRQKARQPRIETACRFAHVSGIASGARATCAGLRAFIVSPSTLTICCKDSNFSEDNFIYGQYHDKEGTNPAV